MDYVMTAELRQAPEVVRGQLKALAPQLSDLAAQMKRRPPRVVVTCARGSSAHAAGFAKYLIERHLGLPVAPAAPGLATIYRQQLRLDQQLFLAISQSGRSDDLIESALSAKAAGALTAAIVNDEASPLAAACDIALPMGAGLEESVAATKTFIASTAILLGFIAAWADKAAIGAALDRLPDRLAAAGELDWSQAAGALSTAQSLVVLGRGPTLAIAQEASLKFKEICNIHAEAFSGAEFQHGPIALTSSGYPVFVFMPGDEAARNLAELAADVSRKGARVIATGAVVGNKNSLPVLTPDHPDTDAVCLIQSFYGLTLHLAEQRGTDVDRPRHLQKVTRTR